MNFFAIFLLIFGIILLLHNLGIIASGVWTIFWNIFWPGVIILIAIKLLIHRKKWRHSDRRPCGWCPFGKSSEEESKNPRYSNAESRRITNQAVFW